MSASLNYLENSNEHKNGSKEFRLEKKGKKGIDIYISLTKYILISQWVRRCC